jgi:Mlc titration factor MtfA (ptsG expression regulator)
MPSLLQRLFHPNRYAAIEDVAWASVLERHPFLDRLCPSEKARLRILATEFLHTRTITCIGGHRLLDYDLMSIAAQASLPVLYLGLSSYDKFSEVIVYPGEFLVAREFTDEDGIVHDISGALAGETMAGGPVVISWDSGEADAACVDNARNDTNVVIHEFAHKLDLAAGEADGIPLFRRDLHQGIAAAHWRDAMEAALEDLRAMVDALEARFPRHLDPESAAGLALYATLPLDAYASQDPAEFFAVASEAYFVAPEKLRDAFTEFHDLLDRFYRPKSALKPQQ